MRTRRGLGVLAACGLVLGMMAISTSGAQAGKWMVAGANVSGELTVEARAELEGGGATLLSTSGGNAVAITCTAAVVPNGAVVTVSEIKGTVNFSGCTTKINGSLSTACVPQSQPIAWGGTVKAVLHNGVAYAEAKGTGGTFATFKFKCAALPTSVTVTGTLWLEDCNGRFEEELVTHLVQEAAVPAKALGGLFYGANQMTWDVSANVDFSDAVHLGKKFSGLAE